MNPSQKTSTGLRIGIAASMVIMMLGLALFLNLFTTYTITNQIKILTDLNMPVGEGISHVYDIQQMQYQSFEDAITYKKLESPNNYEFSKSQFVSFNKEFDYQINKIMILINTHLDNGLEEKFNLDLDTFIKNLDEIKSDHLQFTKRADQIFKLYDKNNLENINPMMTKYQTEHDQISSKITSLDVQIQKLTDNLRAGEEQSKQKSITLQIIIIVSAGIISLALCYFLNLINKDIIREVIRKTKSLQKANRKLEKMNILKDDFINIASHELMSPLQPLHGYVELAQNGDMDKDEAFVGISKQVRQLEEVANRILDICRIDNGKLKSTYEKFDFSNLLMETVLFYRLNPISKVKLETNIESGIEIEADRVAIGQVIRNIIDNAIKFTEDGSINVTVHCNLEKNFVEVSISDNGPGIDREILPKLFNKYITKGPKTQPLKGNGLGLYLCRDIIKMHGGHIFAYNNKTSGATIKFTIPIRPTNIYELDQKILN